MTNAMLFQERLASADADVPSVNSARDGNGISRTKLMDAWSIILEKDYWPVFHMAQAIAESLSDIEGPAVLSMCALTSERLLSTGAVGRHDLAGRIFNRLISDRKLLAAFYTTIPAATLLAGLALSPKRWSTINWSDAEAINDLRVVDPACGTGTLLMAAYRQIVDNVRAASYGKLDELNLHKSLIENVLHGADVVQAAIHLTASTLAAMSPSVRFSQINLHTLKIGIDPDLQSINLGSLDWLEAGEIQSFFSATGEQVAAAKGITGALVERPRANVVISNPPYTRRGSDGSASEEISRVFALPIGDPDSQDRIAKRTAQLIHGTGASQIAGHASSFTVLADRLVVPGGRIALVLPVTAIAGESWSSIRKLISSRYEVEFVVSSHDASSPGMSFDTGIAEILLVARRHNQAEIPTNRGLFVNISRAPTQVTEALALLNALEASAQGSVHRSDGPPVGGTPLIVGGEQWGEIVNGPLGSDSWTAARWRRALVEQFASALERGELWSAEGTRLLERIPVAPLHEVAVIGPQDRQIRGSLGAFDAYPGWDSQAQFPAIWRQQESIHRTLQTEPNARLVPQTGRAYAKLWEQAGTLHITRDVRYNSQRVATVRTARRVLGVRAWHSLNVRGEPEATKAHREMALALWCNSTLGLLLHSNHANRAQAGRGTGSKGMLESLQTLDVRILAPWQLDAAESIWRDMENREFQSFHSCAIDPARIELDNRVLHDLLGFGLESETTVQRLRLALAEEPSIHGSKVPRLP